MIAFIEGLVAGLDGDCAVIAAGGIGYEILMPASALQSLPAPGSPIRVYTHMYVREDNIGLFGFLTRDDLKMFRQLITVSGIGPKGALGVLTGMTADELRFAVLSDDAASIAKAPGIGKKTAQKIILELKDKLNLEEAFEKKAEHNAGAAPAGKDSPESEAVLALAALGYSSRDALKAVKKAIAAGTPADDVEALLKAALREL